jgi:hypothetical protein
MKAIANRYTIEETVVRCLRAGLRRLPHLQRRLRQEGPRARSGDPRGRGRHGLRQARRGRHDADAPAQGALPGGRRPVLNPERLEALAPFEHQLVAEEMRQWL